MTVEEMIERLVDAHGRDGLAHSEDDWRAIFAAGDGPLSVLNLLRFKTEVETTEGVLPGERVYRRYARKAAAAFARVGARSELLRGVDVQTGLGTAPAWDMAVLSEYPSARALAQMWLDPEYIAAHQDRIRAVDDSQALFFRSQQGPAS